MTTFWHAATIRRILNIRSKRSQRRTIRKTKGPSPISERLESRDMFAVVLPASAVSIGGSLNDAGNAVAVDAANNVYHMGTFNGTVDFDPGPAQTVLVNDDADTVDLYVAKYQPDGSLAWARGFDTNSATLVQQWEIAVDANENVYVLSAFTGTVAFDSFSLTSAPLNSMVLMRLDATGSVDWAQSNGVVVGSMALADSTDNSQDAIYLTHSGYVSRLNATTGQYVWTSGNGHGTYRDIAVDLSGSGALYLTGEVGGVEMIGSTNIGSRKSTTALIAKTDLNGTFLWAKPLATAAKGNTNSHGVGVAVADGSVFVTGYVFQSTARFGSIQFNVVGDLDAFVTKLNADGSFAWAVTTRGSSNEWASDIAADTLGNVFVTGFLYGSAILGPDVVPTGMYLTQMNAANGQFLKTWALGGDNVNIDEIRDLTVTASGDVWLIGRFDGVLNLPGGWTLTSESNSRDILLLSFSPSLPAVTAEQTSLLEFAKAVDHAFDADSDYAMRRRMKKK